MMSILLCAGFATRLYPLTRDFPKALLPVAGRPVIDYLVEQVSGLPEIDEIHIVANAKYFDRFSHWSRRWRHRLSERHLAIRLHNDGVTTEGARLGACMDLRFVLRRIGRADGYLVSAGDNIYLFDIADAWRRFLRSNRHCIVALAEGDSEALRNTGVPVFGDGGRVVGVLEKPERPPPGWFCPPLYFLRPTARKILESFLSAGPVDALGHFIDYLCRREPVRAIKIDARRLDIGNAESYHRADRLLRGEPSIE